ncbi:VTT domain-containing protein [Gemmatimonadota bacterium]
MLGQLHRAARFLTKQRGSAERRWDLVIRSAGIAALLGIPVIIAFPRSIPLVWLAVLAIPANSPLSPIIPAAFEPLIMEAAKYEKAIWVTIVALIAYLYMEYLNWHAYAWVLSRRALKGFRETRLIQRSLRYFAYSPFWTVIFFAVTPLPFWAIRTLAILDGYPIRTFMLATAIGRFPRLLAYAWLGSIFRIPTLVLVGVIVGTAAAVILYRLLHGKKLLSDTVIDSAEEQPYEENV